MLEFQRLADLLDMQAVDLEIDRLLSQRQGLPELDEYRSANATTAALQASLEETRATLRQTDLELDKQSGELELGEQKLHAEENRLFAGGIGAREVDHLRKEVAMLKRQNSEREESVLELMETKEGLEKEADRLTAEVADATRFESDLEATIAEKWKVLDGEIARKEARKSDIAPLIPPDLMELYEELRRSKEGVAIGRLAEDQCGGCHLKLTAAEQIEVKKADPPRCLHCRRILVPQ